MGPAPYEDPAQIAPS